MMEWRLKHLMGEYQNQTGKRLTYRGIADATGLSKTTVSAIGTGQIKRPDEETMDALLDYLAEMLDRDLTTQDLWRFERNR